MHRDGVSRRGLSLRRDAGVKTCAKTGKHDRAAECGPRCIAGKAGFWNFHPRQKR
jgi:hypothetical protein